MNQTRMWLLTSLMVFFVVGCSGLTDQPLDEGTGSITGIVSDAGADVIVDDVAVYLLNDLSVYDQTGEDGRFSLGQVPVGLQTVVAVAEGGRAVSTEVTVFGGRETEVNLSLVPTGSLSGTITLEGELIHGDTLVYLPGTSFVGGTDAQGAFSMPSVASGCYTLRAEHPGFLPVEMDPICVEEAAHRSLGAISLIRQGEVECLTDGDCDTNQYCRDRDHLCDYAVGFSAEECDGQDNDGDGFVDEGVAASCGITEGECAQGFAVCLGGLMGACAGEVGPSPELCGDGLDNDCDGETDEVGCHAVRVMFVIDSSGSMQTTDEGYLRVEAIRNAVELLTERPEVKFNIVIFNSRVRVLTDGFQYLTGQENEIFGTSGLLASDSMTDYEGALELAYQELVADIQATDPATLAHTRYVIHFFSDGHPDPVCTGCVTGPQDDPLYDPLCHEDLQVVCTIMDDILLDMDFRTPDLFPALVIGEDYNSEERILARVDQIAALQASNGVGALSLFTTHLYCRDAQGNPTSPLCAAAEEAYGLDPIRDRALLQAMASHGGGSFVPFYSNLDIDFLSYDYSLVQ